MCMYTFYIHKFFKHFDIVYTTYKKYTITGVVEDRLKIVIQKGA